MKISRETQWGLAVISVLLLVSAFYCRSKEIKKAEVVQSKPLPNTTVLDTTELYVPGRGYYVPKKYVSFDTGAYVPKKHVQAKIKKPKRLYIGDSGDDGGGGRMVWGGDTTYSTPDSTSIKLIHYNKTEYAPQYDTIRVMMLVTDTSGSLYVDDIRKAGNRLEGGFTQWKMGYSVRKNAGGFLSYNTQKNAWVEGGNYFHDHYLDADKKIMKKDIVVWDSKRLN